MVTRRGGLRHRCRCELAVAASTYEVSIDADLGVDIEPGEEGGLKRGWWSAVLSAIIDGLAGEEIVVGGGFAASSQGKRKRDVAAGGVDGREEEEQ